MRPGLQRKIVKFKMSPNSLFAILLRSPWWISFALVGAFSLAAVALLPRDYALAGVLGTFPFFAVGCIAAWRQWRAPSAARTSAMQASLQAMPWRALADALEAAWIAQGYQVERLAPGGAADFVLSRGGQTQLASARRWKAAHHGVEPLRELHAVMQKREVTAGLYLLGPGELSDNARLFARDHGLTIVQGDALAQLLLH
jgi:restriction system protein